MAHRVFKSCGEYKHHQGHQGEEAGDTVVACQTQLLRRRTKVKGLFKKKNQNCGRDDKKSFSSSNERESDNHACRKKASLVK
ncbi:hypothetical protein ACJRO7_018238 [Eucalyptus globulus]|uniref:Uncharacterized protein n=1 Tax=Eucalyptus globulus TaxID=34317 RepID=A0ABD3KT22_EUCGL